MTDPRPLLEQDATEIEKVLLLAGRNDGPPKGATSRLLAAIEGLPPVPDDLSAATHASVRPAASLKWVKMAVVAVGMGGAVAAGYHLARPHAAAPSGMPKLPAAPETAPSVTPGKAGAPEGQVAPGLRGDGMSSPGQALDLARQEGSASPRRARAAGRAREATREATLGDETRALDRVRQALDAHRSPEALRLLDEYHRSFPQGRLRPEATVLRLAGLVQAGRHDAADSLARQLLADPAYKAYAPRILSLIGEAKP